MLEKFPNPKFRQKNVRFFLCNVIMYFISPIDRTGMHLLLWLIFEYLKNTSFQSKCKVYWNEKFSKILVLCTSIEEFEQFDNSLNDRDLQKEMVIIFFFLKGKERLMFLLYMIYMYIYIYNVHTLIQVLTVEPNSICDMEIQLLMAFTNWTILIFFSERKD